MGKMSNLDIMRQEGRVKYPHHKIHFKCNRCGKWFTIDEGQGVPEAWIDGSRAPMCPVCETNKEHI